MTELPSPAASGSVGNDCKQKRIRPGRQLGALKRGNVEDSGRIAQQILLHLEAIPDSLHCFNWCSVLMPYMRLILSIVYRYDFTKAVYPNTL